MNNGKTESTANAPDAAFVAAIAREVIARLSADPEQPPKSTNPPSIPERVVTAELVLKLAGTPSEACVGPKAVITPAARDEARRRGITLRRSAILEPSGGARPATSGSAATVPPHITTTRIITAPQTCQAASSGSIVDPTQPERAEAVAAQLAGRGITQLDVVIVLSDYPAAETHHQCTAHRQRAVMVNSIADLSRFAEELDPTVWVLDMVRLNFVAAVNAIAQIAKLRSARQ